MLRKPRMKKAFLWMLILLISCLSSPFQHMSRAVAAEAAPAEGTVYAADGSEARDLPHPRGGSEKDNRQLNPLPQVELHQNHPQIFFLRGPTDEKKVALTFDDGPDTRFTPGVLDALNRYGVKGTFFVMGARAEALPDLTERIHREGHVLANHGYWHPLLPELTVAGVLYEVRRTEEVLQNIVGITPALFRPPYGEITEEQILAIGEQNYAVIGWTVDSVDWAEPGTDQIVETVLDNVVPGAIILMHDGGDWTQDLSGTVEALDVIIPRLLAEGYEFVTVPELLNIPATK
jgi:peptidoglycan-N-acetylglucosamine deacetylase